MNQEIVSVDLGSNSFRVLKYDCKNHQIISEYNEVVGMADGLVDTGLISKEAQERVIKAILHSVEVINYDPSKAVCVTTAAMRKASNNNEVLKYLKFADLRNPRQTISPFSLTDDGLNQLFLDLNYLCHLGEELSKPILPREAHLEYLSSQYLCELIKDCGFDGVVYKSSVGDGDNFAIFYDENLEAIDIKCYKINNVNFDFS